MERLAVSAPGKLVLIGEYAVLYGAPAVVTAVDRRAVVTLNLAASGSWQVAAPGLAPRAAQFDLGPGGTVHWRDKALGREFFKLVERLLAGLQASCAVDLEALPPLAMVLDSSSFFETPESGSAKLGLGSSAALTVALASALEAWVAGGEAPESSSERLQRSVDLHRSVQGGAGSGIDVAASLIGGVVRYRLDADGSVAEATPMSLPEELHMLFVWTGRAASTADYLERLKARREEASRRVNHVLDELGQVSSNGVDAFAAGDIGVFLESVDAFWKVLDRLGEVIGMPILSAEHRALRQLAAGCGIRYKPSGAGGGDFGLGFATDVAAASELAERAAFEGFRVVELSVDLKGVTVLNQ